MFSARQPVQPIDNLPQALLALMDKLQDKNFLPTLVRAAKDISEANRVTIEEGEALRRAGEVIAQADAADKRLKDLLAGIGDIELRESNLAKKEAAHKKAREIILGAP